MSNGDSQTETQPRLDELANELVQRKVDVLVAGSTPAIRAAQKATVTLPIGAANANDPIGTGFVDSFGRPGHNITGLSTLSVDLGPKLVELMRIIVPQATRIAVLTNPANLSNRWIAESLQKSLSEAGLAGSQVQASNSNEIEAAFLKMRELSVDAAMIAADTIFVEERQQIADFAIRDRLPTVFSFRENVEAGGLMSYGQSLSDGYRRAASFVDRILKGATPNTMPIEQFTKLELVVNLKTAKALGLDLARSFLALADEIIE